MATLVREHIFAEVKSAKYFSVSVDSTPDISHVDQLTCILPYVLSSGPVERFSTFLNMRGHSGIQLAESLLEYLKTNDIDIADCIGQSYDNAKNMIGKYNGIQARSRQHCIAECPASHIALILLDSYPQIFVRTLYSAFSSVCTPALQLHLIVGKFDRADKLSSNSFPTVKRMSDTRQSARGHH